MAYVAPPKKIKKNSWGSMAPLVAGILLVCIFFAWIFVKEREKQAEARAAANEAQRAKNAEIVRLQEEKIKAEKEAAIARQYEILEHNRKVAAEKGDIGVNLCRQKGVIVSQSATQGDNTALLAADGNKDSRLQGGSVSVILPKLNRKEKRKDPAWWMVNFGKPREIKQVVITNCMDESCKKRLSNFCVAVLDANKESVYYEEFFTDKTKYSGETFIIKMPPDIRGKWVRIELLGENLNGDGALTLAEVEVFGPISEKK